ncbi:MAG: FAD-dependent oxidoreductase [Synergistaceae bacterium]|jgi:2-enoate reductase|nr:FAD-dependent oxidoreductase [Synergistaceae bacterium]
MKTKYEALFSPLKIAGTEIKNRIAMMPMGVFTPRLMQPNGAYSTDGADYYIERAKGGTGLIITGLIHVFHFGGGVSGGCINHDRESFIKDSQYLVNGVHKYGGKVFLQLAAGLGRAALPVSPDDDLIAACAIRNVWDPTFIHREMTRDEIEILVHSFGTGAKNAMDAGADGVEIHAVHEGYLLDQFAISCMNTRSDEYGGSLENRLRFAVDIVKEIKKTCGGDFPVSLRYSVRSMIKDFNRGALPGEEFQEVGRDLEESRLAAKILTVAGYDMLNCDNGTYDCWYWPHPPVYMPKACNLEDTKQIKSAVNVPIACAGRFDNPELANDVIRKKELDIMGMGRPLLADPYIAQKFFEGREDDIRPCISCHMACLGRIMMRNDISCAVNPACGRERELKLKPAEVKKKVLVIGGGIGGMEAARVCALRGHTVDLYEKSGLLGGVFNAAAAPEFKEDDKKLLLWYEKQIKDAGVNVKFNVKFTKDMIASTNYDEIFVATGANERRLSEPFLQGNNVHYAIETLLSQSSVTGENVIVIGGGLTGCEIAYDLGRNGKKVTIVEMTGSIINSHGLSAANYNMLVELLEYYRIRVFTDARIIDYDGKTATIRQIVKNTPNVAGRAKMRYMLGPDGMETTHKAAADSIVISVGYISDSVLYEQIRSDNVHLIGDAKKPTNVMEAVWQAYEIAIKI